MTETPVLKVLVLGASGYVGSWLVPELLRHGYQVRAASRRRAVLEARNWPGVEIAEVDLLQPATLPPALVGVDVVYYLVHAMASGQDFAERERIAARNFVQAANAANTLKRIVYLGALQGDGDESEHLAARNETGRILHTARAPVTEIRSGVIVGPGSAAIEVIRDLVNYLPVMITPRWVRSKSPPIALSNLLTYLVRAPEIPEMAGKVFAAAGPEYLTYENLMRQYGEVVGKSPRILPVPVLSPRLSSYWLRLITTVPVPIARALIDGLKHDILADPEPLRKRIPQRLLTFREALEQLLEDEKRSAVAARWVEGALTFREDNPAYAFYAKRASGSAVAHASPEAVWRTLMKIGGHNRYFYMNWAWTVREYLDWAIGGPGRTHGRRSLTELRVGDMVDSWRVIAVQPGRTLTLMMGMKAPGAGVLEFELEPRPSEADKPPATRITVTAYWHPAGVWGLLYWYAMAPFHLAIFRGMTREIARQSVSGRD